MKIEEPIWVDEVKNATYDLTDLPTTIEEVLREYLKLELGPVYNESLTSLEYAGGLDL